MDDLATLSETKLIFRCLQAAHHYLNFLRTPKAFLRQQSKMLRFIRPSQMDEDLRVVLSLNNRSWSDQQITALRAHYERSFHKALAVLASRQKLPRSEFDSAFSTATKWAARSLGEKLQQGTVNHVQRLTRQALQEGLREPALPSYAVPQRPTPASGSAPSIRPLMDLVIPRPRKPSRPGSYAEAVSGRPSKPKPRPSKPKAKAPVAPPAAQQEATSSGWTKVQSRKKKKLVTAPPAPKAPLTAVRGHQDPLSNFFEFPMSVDGKVYPTAEHLYQCQKAKHFGNWKAVAAIQRAPTAGKAKRASDAVFKTPDFKALCRKSTFYAKADESWRSSQRRRACQRTLATKAKQCPPFREALLATGENHIIHNVEDTYWGTGSSNPRDPIGANGENTFGALLMATRQDLRSNDQRSSKGPAQAPGPLASGCQSPPVAEEPMVVVEASPLSDAQQPPPGPSSTPNQEVEELISGSFPSTSPEAKSTNLSRSSSPHGVEFSQFDLPGLNLTTSEEEFLLTTDDPLVAPSQSWGTAKESVWSTPDSESVGEGAEAAQLDHLGPTVSNTDPHPPPKPLVQPLAASAPKPQRLTLSRRRTVAQVPEATPKNHFSSCPTVGRAPRPTFTSFSSRAPLDTSSDAEDRLAAVRTTYRCPSSKDKSSWFLPHNVTARTLILGDSLLNRFKRMPEDHLNSSIRILSYPGAKFEHMINILADLPPNLEVKNLIFCCGINNKNQNYHSTAHKHIRNVHNKILRAFPAATLWFPAFGQRLSDPGHNTNLADFTRAFSDHGWTILPVTSAFSVESDGIHWTVPTADRSLAKWLRHLNGGN